MLEQENNAMRLQRGHHHMMQKTLFISFLAMHPLVEKEGAKTHSQHDVDRGAYDQFYHYGVDTTKRQRIEMINKKYRLNSHV